MRAKGLFAYMAFTVTTLLGVSLLTFVQGSDNRPLAEATMLQHKPPVKTTKRPARVPAKSQYLIEMKVLEIGPKGKPNGNTKTIARPKLITLEGHEAKLVVGGNVMIPGANQLESIPTGLACTFNLYRRKTDNTPVVDFTFSYTKHSRENNEEHLIRRHALRTIRTYELGKQARLALAGLGNDGKQIEVFYTIRKVVPSS